MADTRANGKKRSSKKSSNGSIMLLNIKTLTDSNTAVNNEGSHGHVNLAMTYDEVEKTSNPAVSQNDVPENSNPAVNDTDILKHSNAAVNHTDVLQNSNPAVNPTDVLQNSNPAVNPTDVLKNSNPAVNHTDVNVNIEEEKNGVLPYKEETSILLDPSAQYKKVMMSNLAPLHPDEDSWRMPVDIFSSKKQNDYKHYSKRLKSYYKTQDELITAYEDITLGVDIDIPTEPVPNSSLKKAAFFSKITLLINFALLVAKAVASALSGSISIISSLMDSCLDLVSGSIMWWATRAVKRRDPYDYPQGRTKLEPVAIIILSVVMFLASVQLIREAVEKVVGISDMSSSLPIVEAPTFAIAGSTVVIKLILYLVCRNVQSPIVQALAQDHRNDVMSNAVAIVCGYLGSKNFYEIVDMYGFAYLDPVGAILISFYIMFNWSKTGWKQMKLLTGHTARPEFLSKLTWICFNHHPLIRHIDTVRAFHFGCNFLVEVDIILPCDMSLQEAHDIGEHLQQKLENVPEVERAFVHLDYEFTHKPRSEHKVV